jgi:dihydropteroate synthase
MHNRGRSRQMYKESHYVSVVDDVIGELAERVESAVAAGIARDRLIVDPGIGFAKQAAHSLELLARLQELAVLDRPLLVGVSRKSFLKAGLGERLPGDREWGTAAAVATSVMGGAHIVRVHGVKDMVDVVRTIDAIRDAERAT